MSPVVAEQYFMFKKSLLLRAELQEIVRVVGSTEGLVCLEIGSPNPFFSYRLRKLGGQWHTAIINNNALQAFTELLGENVYVVPDLKMPFKKKIFDVIVIIDLLEFVKNDESFIEECHGLLKSDGRLVVNVIKPKSWSLLNPLRTILGLASENTGRYRAGYTESRLFNILKHGFDVSVMRSYSKWFTEFVDLLVQFSLMRIEAKKHVDSAERKKRVMKLASIFYWVAYQLDMFLFFTKGFRLVASAKRRAWRPRNAPVLIDGRSISEVVLTKAAD